MTVKVISYRDFRPIEAIDTTSYSQTWSRGLSPFFVGPVPLWDGSSSVNMENAWQFSKVYPEHVGLDGLPSDVWKEWSRTGWADERAHRYPMGKGVVPLYSWWDGEKLSYVDARKKIYFPLYAKAVILTEAFQKLQRIYEAVGSVTLVDFDGYDHRKLGLDWKGVLNNPNKPMGHAFIIGYLLEQLETA